MVFLLSKSSLEEMEEKFPGKGLVSFPKSVVKLNNLDSLPLIPARTFIRNVPVLRTHLFNFICEYFFSPSLEKYSLKNKYEIFKAHGLSQQLPGNKTYSGNDTLT